MKIQKSTLQRIVQEAIDELPPAGSQVPDYFQRGTLSDLIVILQNFKSIHGGDLPVRTFQGEGGYLMEENAKAVIEFRDAGGEHGDVSMDEDCIAIVSEQ